MEKTQLECRHCHQPIETPVLGNISSAQYCCFGCKVVDELLQEGPLFQLEEIEMEKYLYLDTPDLQSRLLNFKEADFARIQIALPAIHCSSCIYLLETLPNLHPALLKVEVNFGKKSALISYVPNLIKLSQLAALLEYIGYAPDFQSAEQKTNPNRKKLLIQLGVAGFFFGNTMLLAIPEYLHSLEDAPELRNFFHYLMLLFSLPVLIYSGQDYFTKSYKGLRAGVLGVEFPIAIGLIALFARSSYEVLSMSGSGYFDSLTGLIFFLLIGRWYQQKTFDNFSFDRDFKHFIPLAVHLLNKRGEWNTVDVNVLREGDNIKIHPGEVLPTDSYLMQDHAELDYSYITGESTPLLKRKGELVYAGAKQLGSGAKYQVLREVNTSYLSSLWKSTQEGNDSAKKLTSLTDRIARYFTPAILLLAILAGAWWHSHSWTMAFNVFTAVLIVACPCALALAEPFSQGSTLRWLGSFGFYLKDSSVVGRLAELHHLVFDKTGTLTASTSLRCKWHGSALSPENQMALRSLVELSHHPFSKAVYKHLHSACIELADFEEIPGQGLFARANGRSIRFGKASFVGLEVERTASRSYLAIEGEVLGYFSFSQELRPGLKRMFHQLHRGYSISLLSGDQPKESKSFQALMGTATDLRFEQSPRDKQEYIQELQAKGQSVLMLGDGLNDAAALQQANVGISLCEVQINYFPSSDALLQADQLWQLPQLLDCARFSKKITLWAIGLSLLYNVVGISLAFAGLISPLVCAILMPLSSASVVIFSSVWSRHYAFRMLKKSEAKN